jgi:hypothetical protein
MERPRNNVGAWATRNVEPPADRKGFAYYAAKDSVMAKEAKCGVMLWDGRSKGTLSSILNLVGAEKRTLVYFSPTKEFYVLANGDDLQALLARCEKSDLDVAARGLGLKHRSHRVTCHWLLCRRYTPWPAEIALVYALARLVCYRGALRFAVAVW